MYNICVVVKLNVEPGIHIAMQVSKQEKLNVIATFASFKQEGVQRRITPWQITRPGGTKHKVAEIRRTYMERVGDTTYVHFVIHTTDDHYFDIVFNNKKMSWMLVLELEDGNTLLDKRNR